MIKYLILFMFLMTAGCSYFKNPNDIKVGMYVTNGYCEGYAAAIYPNLGEVTVLNASGNVVFNSVYLNLKDTKEVK